MKRRLALILLVYAGLIGGGWLLGNSLPEIAGFQVRPVNEPEVHRMLMTVALVFVIASAFPFVPGAEIGFALLTTFGARIAFLVYLCMAAALTLSFLVGRFVPATWLSRFFAFLRLERSAELVRTIADLPLEEREKYLTRQVTNRYLQALVRYRYVALAVALNVPGNSLLGGGGGLALAAGMSRLYGAGGFLLTVLLAVAPVPVLVWALGYQP